MVKPPAWDIPGICTSNHCPGLNYAMVVVYQQVRGSVEKSRRLAVMRSPDGIRSCNNLTVSLACSILSNLTRWTALSRCSAAVRSSWVLLLLLMLRLSAGFDLSRP